MLLPSWEKWWQMAQDSLTSAQLLQRNGQYRASASRTYYAVYQAVTTLLLYYKQTPPADREAWSHDATPDLLRQLSGMILSSDARKDAALRLEASYELRVIADYVGNANLEQVKLKASLKDAGFIVKLIRDILPQD